MANDWCRFKMTFQDRLLKKIYKLFIIFRIKNRMDYKFRLKLSLYINMIYISMVITRLLFKNRKF